MENGNSSSLILSYCIVAGLVLCSAIFTFWSIHYAWKNGHPGWAIATFLSIFLMCGFFVAIVAVLVTRRDPHPRSGQANWRPYTPSSAMPSSSDSNSYDPNYPPKEGFPGWQVKRHERIDEEYRQKAEEREREAEQREEREEAKREAWNDYHEDQRQQEEERIVEEHEEKLQRIADEYNERLRQKYGDDDED